MVKNINFVKKDGLYNQEVEKFENQQKYFEELDKLINSFGKKCVAIGECGLGLK